MQLYIISCISNGRVGTRTPSECYQIQLLLCYNGWPEVVVSKCTENCDYHRQYLQCQVISLSFPAINRAFIDSELDHFLIVWFSVVAH